MAESNSVSARGSLVGELGLAGPWGAVEFSFGKVPRGNWVVDVGLGPAVPVQMRGSCYVADFTGRSRAGLVQRAVLARHLSAHGGLVLHAGAVVDANGAATLFLGRSGAGKTTISTQAAGRLLGDDTVVVWPSDTGRLQVLSTPFRSAGGRPAEVDEGWPQAICTLAWGTSPRAVRLGQRELLAALLRSVYWASESGPVGPLMATVLALASEIPGYCMTFPQRYRFTPAVLWEAE